MVPSLLALLLDGLPRLRFHQCVLKRATPLDHLRNLGVRHRRDCALPARYASLLRPANSGEELGDLVVEPVCVKSVTQTDAIAICATDPDPLAPPYPALGESVWLEGRYVLDLDHGGWAELHPLFRWGLR